MNIKLRFFFIIITWFYGAVFSMEKDDSDTFNNTFKLYIKYQEESQLIQQKLEIDGFLNKDLLYEKWMNYDNEKNQKLINFIKEEKIDVNAQDDREQTILHHAVYSKNISFIYFLITKTNINKDIKNILNKTALDMAFFRGYHDIVMLLDPK